MTLDEIERVAYIKGNLSVAHLAAQLSDNNPVTFKEKIESLEEQVTALKRNIREQDQDLFNIRNATFGD